MNFHPRVTVDISSKSIIRVILFGFLIIALYYLRSLILVILTAIVIASFVESGVRFFGKRRMGRTLSVILIYLMSLLVLAGVFYLFIPVVVSQIDELAKLIAKYLPQVQQIQNTSGVIGANIGESATTLENIVTSFKAITQGNSGGLFQTLTVLLGGIANVVLIGVISFYLSVEEHGIEKFLRIITPVKQEEYVLSLWERTRKKISR